MRKFKLSDQLGLFYLTNEFGINEFYKYEIDHKVRIFNELLQKNIKIKIELNEIDILN